MIVHTVIFCSVYNYCQMNGQERRHRDSRRYVNTSLREIEEEDISREDDRESVRNGRRKAVTKLPHIFEPDRSNDLETRKSQPFSWCKTDSQYSRSKPVYPEVPSGYFESYYKAPQREERRQKPTIRINTQPPKQQLSTQNMTPSEYSKSRRIIEADRLERNYAYQGRPNRSGGRQLRHVRSNNRTRPADSHLGGHHRRLLKAPRIHTITDEQVDDSSSVKSRQYLTQQPLTFGIFAPDENPEFQLNPITNQQQMRELYLSIPAPLEHRREETVREFCYRLYRNNSLFRKVEYVTCVEFVCHCQIYCLERGRVLYEVNSDLGSSYIVLWGAMELYSEDQILQGSYQMGSTLCEEYLLTGSSRKIGEIAKAGKKGAGVLQLSHNSLTAVRQSLTKIFLKKDLVMLQSIFRKNYFSKKSIRKSFSIRHGETN